MDKIKNSKIKILIVETSKIYKPLIEQALQDSSDIEIVGTAPNGSIGLLKTAKLNPDVIILDAEIKEPNPLKFINSCVKEQNYIGFIMTYRSNASETTIEKTIHCLANGAFDLIEKPNDNSEEQVIDIIKRRLLPKIRSFSIIKYSKLAKLASGKAEAAENYRGMSPAASNKIKKIEEQHKLKEPAKYKLLAIGASTGGTEALMALIPTLPESFPLPVVIVLHMPKLFTASMAQSLNSKSKLKVKEAEEGEVLQEGYVYLSQGGTHMTLAPGKDKCFIKYNDGPPENGCKPSVDVLFRSIIPIYGQDTIAVLLTGAGADGAKSIGLLKQNNAKTIAQDEATSVVWGMPGTAVRAGYIDEVMPLEKIADRLIEIAEENI